MIVKLPAIQAHMSRRSIHVNRHPLIKKMAQTARSSILALARLIPVILPALRDVVPEVAYPTTNGVHHFEPFERTVILEMPVHVFDFTERGAVWIRSSSRSILERWKEPRVFLSIYTHAISLSKRGQMIAVEKQSSRL